MEANLDYTQFIYKNIMISFIGDKRSVQDMKNYLYYHIPDGTLTMSAILTRLQINDLYVYVHNLNKKAKYLSFMMIKRIFKNKTNKLLSRHEFMSAIVYLREDVIVAAYGIPHTFIVKRLASSMWKRFITKLEQNDLDPEFPDPTSTLLFHELAEKEDNAGGD